MLLVSAQLRIYTLAYASVCAGYGIGGSVSSISPVVFLDMHLRLCVPYCKWSEVQPHIACHGAMGATGLAHFSARCLPPESLMASSLSICYRPKEQRLVLQSQAEELKGNPGWGGRQGLHSWPGALRLEFVHSIHNIP